MAVIVVGNSGRQRTSRLVQPFLPVTQNIAQQVGPGCYVLTTGGKRRKATPGQPPGPGWPTPP